MDYAWLLTAAVVAASPAVAAEAGALSVPSAGAPDSHFVTTWETSLQGDSITIPVGGATGTYTVDWGDGTLTTHEGDATHAYGSPGSHTVRVYGDFARIRLGSDAASAAMLHSIDQWGTAGWTTMESAFEGPVRNE